MDLQELMDRVHQTALEHGWWEDNPTQDHIPTCLALIHSEISEALEDFRASTSALDKYKIYTIDGKPEGMSVELADAIIRILDLCAYYKLPIIRALEQKITYNETRPYRHGGKII